MSEKVSFVCEGVEVLTPEQARSIGLLGGGEGWNASDEHVIGLPVSDVQAGPDWLAQDELPRYNRGAAFRSSGMTNRDFVETIHGGLAAESIYGPSCPTPSVEVRTFHELCSGMGATGGSYD